LQGQIADFDTTNINKEIEARIKNWWSIPQEAKNDLIYWLARFQSDLKKGKKRDIDA